MQRQKQKHMAPCRPSHGGNLEKGSAYHSGTQAVGREKWATARRVGRSSTSQLPETSYGTGEEMLRLRIGTTNIGSRSGRSGEVIDMVQRRGLDFCCVRNQGGKGVVHGCWVIINFSGRVVRKAMQGLVYSWKRSGWITLWK